MAALGAGSLLEWIAAGIASLFVGEVAKEELKKQAAKKPDTAEPDPEPDPEQKPKDKPVPAPPDLSKKCDLCGPDCGVMARRNHSMSPGSREYQGRITGFPFEVIDDNRGWSMEWVYNGVDFDGFVSPQCLLQEAKGYYDFLFDEFERPKFFAKFTLAKMLSDANRQIIAAGPSPRVRLRWYFMSPKAEAYFGSQFAMGVTKIETEYRP